LKNEGKQDSKTQRFLFACAVGVLRVIALLPLTLLLKTGNVFGFLLLHFSSKTVHVSRVNLQLCFPELSSAEREKLLRASIYALGQSVSETLVIWFKNASQILERNVEMEGEQYWEAALKEKRGVILLSCHSGSLDLNVALAHQLNRNKREFAFTYRQPSSACVDEFLREVRKPYADSFFPVSNLLGISRVLKKGGIVWYAPDIETSKKGRVFVKFMGVDAATPTAIPKLAESTGALVLPYMHKRLTGNRYGLRFFPPLEFQAAATVEQGTQQVNNAIELIVRERPEAYWWCIKRFRYREDGGPSVYRAR